MGPGQQAQQLINSRKGYGDPAGIAKQGVGWLADGAGVLLLPASWALRGGSIYCNPTPAGGKFRLWRRWASYSFLLDHVVPVISFL